MISHEDALKFAREWVEAWNSHDLAKILSHYSEDFALTTPYIVEVMKEPTGAIKGKKAVRDYWESALQRIPDLHLELIARRRSKKCRTDNCGFFEPVHYFKRFPFFVSFVLFVVKDFYVCSNPKLILVAAMLR